MSAERVRIALVYPELLGKYGDEGNALVLERRCALRGIESELLRVQPGEPLPADADIYLLGGGEDAMQTTAARLLREDGALVRAAASGAVVFGVCAGYQILGHSFVSGAVAVDGLGLLDVVSSRAKVRMVGEIRGLHLDGSDREPLLIGFENHGGISRLGPEARPLARLAHGGGNGDGRTEGAVQGNVIGTYAHGPALGLNPQFADSLLERVAGPLQPLDDRLTDQVRSRRQLLLASQRRRPSLKRRMPASPWRRHRPE
jgi:CobQ-like glutamine amidotransferase family enzyme